MIDKVRSWTDLSAYWSGVAGRKNNSHLDMSVSIWWAQGPSGAHVLRTFSIVHSNWINNAKFTKYKIHCYVLRIRTSMVCTAQSYKPQVHVYLLLISAMNVSMSIWRHVLLCSQRCQEAIILSYGYILTKAAFSCTHELTFLGHKLQWYSTRCRNDDPHGRDWYTYTTLSAGVFTNFYYLITNIFIFQHLRSNYFLRRIIATFRNTCNYP